MIQVAYMDAASCGGSSPDPQDPAVLVVEDEPLICDLVAEALEMAGYRVLTAADADEALRILATEQISLLFTDIDLGPGASGLVLAQAARGKRPQLKVVYASGRRRDLSPDELVPESTFVPKPYRPTQVCDLLARALEA